MQSAMENDIILGVETEASNIINTPIKARAYLDAFPNGRLKIIMDGANLFLPEQINRQKDILTEAFELLGRDIVLAHAKDLATDEGLAFVAAGQGVLDYETYLALLKQVNYNGALILHGLEPSQVPESVAFLKRSSYLL